MFKYWLFWKTCCFLLVRFWRILAWGFVLFHACQRVWSFSAKFLVLSFQSRPINLHLKFGLFFLISHAVIFLLYNIRLPPKTHSLRTFILARVSSRQTTYTLQSRKRAAFAKHSASTLSSNRNCLVT